MRVHRRAARLLHELRPENEEVLDLANRALHQSSAAGLPHGLELAEPRDLPQLPVAGRIDHHVLWLARRHLRVEQFGLGLVDGRFRKCHSGCAHWRQGREARVKAEKVAFHLFGQCHQGWLHVQLQQVGHRQNLGDVRYLEGGFRMRVQHDLCIPDARVLRLYCPPFGQVVCDQNRWNRHIHRVPRLAQRRLEVAIDQVAHDKVTHQGGQGIDRH